MKSMSVHKLIFYWEKCIRLYRLCIATDREVIGKDHFLYLPVSRVVGTRKKIIIARHGET